MCHVMSCSGVLTPTINISKTSSDCSLSSKYYSQPPAPRAYLCICLGFAYRLNYVEYIMMNAEDKMNKINKQEASFTDDGFSR